MSASPPAPLIWGARLCRLVPEGMVWDARMHQWVPQPEPYNALAVPAGAAGERKGLSAEWRTPAAEERFGGSGGSEHCGNWGTREPGPQLSERRAAERTGAARTTRLRVGGLSLLS